MPDIDFVALINESCKIANKQVDFTHKLYYNKETGEPIAYSMKDLDGDFIEVTKEQYHKGRYDIVVRNNKILSIDNINYVRKLVPSKDGIRCEKSNVLLLNKSSDTRWKIRTKELL
tara:strand:+ start:1679 stop:2026 length:348 start_codon:yes stop_codon:yes gene_type:complete